MSSYEILWTVLPNGAASPGEVRVSVLVTPRLGPPIRRLGKAGELVDWPRTLRDRVLPHLRIRWSAHDETVAPQLDTQSPPADSTLWTKLFTPDTPVNSDPEPLDAAAGTADLVLRSFPARMVQDRIDTLYRGVGVAVVDDRLGSPQASGDGPLPDRPWNLPNSFSVINIPVVGDMLKFTTNRSGTYDALEELFPRGEPGPPHLRPARSLAERLRPKTVDRGGDYQRDATRFAFAEGSRFYDRPVPAAPDGLAPPPPPEPPKLEFHNVCGFLADYRELLRRLGLAIDLVVPVPAAVTETGTLRVEFEDPRDPYNAEALRPSTRFRYVPGQQFTAAASDDNRIRDGWLSLSGPQWSVSDLDVDGSMLKAVTFVDLLEKLSSSTPAAEEHLGTGSAALQGAGITVYCEDRDAWLASQIGDDAARTLGVDDAAAVLDAGHLVRGYRVDVATVAAGGALGPWRSLCRRQGSYTIRRAGEPPYPIAGIADDEGSVRGSAITHDAATPDERYVHQALFGWEGWSLAAPLPGRTLAEDGQPQPADPEVSGDFPLDTKFVPVRGTLPKLRYGPTYRLRVRVVDLAGNSLGPGTDAPLHALSAPITYSRWEPVLPPAVVPSKPFNEGESAQCLVIRSTVTDGGDDVPAWQWALERSADIPERQDPPAEPTTDGLSRPYLSYDERHIAPPKSALQMAERHGLFDDAFGPTRSDEVRDRFFKAASREDGTFLDTKVRDPNYPHFERDLLFFDEIAVAKHDAYDPTPVTALPIPRGAGLASGEFVVHTRDDLLLPYLPDVLARGVTFCGLPGAPRAYPVSFSDTIHDEWPDAAPLRLRVEEGEGAPELFGRQLTVFLPKAETATVRVSCHLNTADLPLFRVWRLLTASDYWRRLTGEQRDALERETVAGLNWMLTPYVELRLVHAVEKPLAQPGLRDLRFARQPDQTFATVDGGILRSHPKSTGQVDIDASWHEWVDDLTESAPHQIQGYARVGAVTLEPWDAAEISVARGREPIRHDFGDTKHRNVAYQPTATTRFREYFHPSITDRPELITRAGQPSTGPSGRGWPIPSSRRPEPPAPAYLLPTFRWSRTADSRAGRVTSVRGGAGARVYLNRPWFSSGDDELLAVILEPTPASPLPDQLATRWGTDPVWSDTTALPTPALGHFPNPAAAPTELRLAESVAGRPLTASAAAYQPAYDPDTRLWYCDVDLDLGAAARDTAYFPYLRLALARYQPHSVASLELSRIVLAEFAQPVPRRVLSVAQTSSGGLLVTLSGPAAANDLGALAGLGLPSVAASHSVTATVQQRELISDPELDWRPTGIQLELSCQAAGSGFSWTGEVTASDVSIIPEYRPLVEARERYTTDPGTAEETVTIGGQQIPAGHRLTYADTVPLRVRGGHLVIDFVH